MIMLFGEWFWKWDGVQESRYLIAGLPKKRWSGTRSSAVFLDLWVGCFRFWRVLV